MNKQEKELLQHFRQLDVDNQNTLMRFAEFLAQSNEDEPQEIAEPEYIEALEGESVVGALKRLSASYFMLDKSKILNETSALMAQHIIQGRDRQEVIGELEVVFKTHYEKIKSNNNV